MAYLFSYIFAIFPIIILVVLIMACNDDIDWEVLGKLAGWIAFAFLIALYIESVSALVTLSLRTNGTSLVAAVCTFITYINVLMAFASLFQALFGNADAWICFCFTFWTLLPLGISNYFIFKNIKK
ncbi:hypothetical protein [Spiroplasma sp. BIUS-1]|uniref:hypothetical protein n=1 Tax=Spiroplasma sp. BIUS-1 TaxID=216964 RepID=UPI0013A69988|nr:hypothetical protein [Spiroplasma sp. BIUS-1]